MGFCPYTDYGQVVPFALVIDTDSYAGNFEREMCAWITGFEGEHYPGGIEYIVETANEQLGEKSGELIDLLDAVNHDQYGQMEVIMTYTPGTCEYNSVAIMLNDRPSDELLALMAERARTFPEASVEKDRRWWTSIGLLRDMKPINILGIRLESYTTVVTKTEEEL